MTGFAIRDKLLEEMTRTNRLFQLMQCLRAGAPGRDLGASARTVRRDIATLRGLGTVIDAAAGFGFTLIEDPALPPMGFDHDELEALVLGLCEVEQIGDPDLAAAAARAVHKLRGCLPPGQSARLRHAALSAKHFRRPAPPSISVAALRQVTRAEFAVEFAYRDAAGIASRRRVKPLGIVYMDRATVLLAWCHLRRDFRVFRLDRMSELTTTGPSFRPLRVPVLRDAMARIRRDTTRLAKSRESGD